MLKDGVKTTEFITLIVTFIVTVLLSLFGQYIGADLPREAFISIIVFVISRSIQKYYEVPRTDGKPAWKTSEFWFTVLYSVVAAFDSSDPTISNSAGAVITWTLIRTGLKVKAAKALSATNTT